MSDIFKSPKKLEKLEKKVLLEYEEWWRKILEEEGVPKISKPEWEVWKKMLSGRAAKKEINPSKSKSSVK